MPKADNIYKKLFLDKKGHFVVAQFPNIPLSIWLISVIINMFVHNQTAHNIISVTGTLALTIWAILEIFSGVNLFRKILGSVVLAYIVYSITQVIFY